MTALAALGAWLKPRLLWLGAALSLGAVLVLSIFAAGRSSGAADRLRETIRDQRHTIRAQRDMARAAAGAPRGRDDVARRLRDGSG